MNLLGFDTSTAATSACLLRADGEAFEVVPEPGALFAAPAHARELLPSLDEVLTRGETGWDEVQAIAVGIGPGTFTGRHGVGQARAAPGADLDLRPDQLAGHRVGQDGVAGGGGTQLLEALDERPRDRGQPASSPARIAPLNPPATGRPQAQAPGKPVRTRPGTAPAPVIEAPEGGTPPARIVSTTPNLAPAAATPEHGLEQYEATPRTRPAPEGVALERSRPTPGAPDQSSGWSAPEPAPTEPEAAAPSQPDSLGGGPDNQPLTGESAPQS